MPHQSTRVQQKMSKLQAQAIGLGELAKHVHQAESLEQVV